MNGFKIHLGDKTDRFEFILFSQQLYEVGFMIKLILLVRKQNTERKLKSFTQARKWFLHLQLNWVQEKRRGWRPMR